MRGIVFVKQKTAYEMRISDWSSDVCSSVLVAKIIQVTLADRLDPDGRPIPLVAETGGQNAMIVDSSALPEQVVGDVLVSAFDSAGQRCTALRVLCLQDRAEARRGGQECVSTC